MSHQIEMDLPADGVTWILYVEREIRGREQMVLLTNSSGKVKVFTSYEDAADERAEHALSVIAVRTS